ncbi:acyltransferase [Acinetobacter guillouiae]|uniref:acyltransferase family protein n=1 Tax=Acinetobacter guillouiae TaxID=106649 RepID=UPI0021D218BB|nr:acyltransferase [Acinetobacter guillouiae]MCU4492631.1 acyltransferase [Acinetobacter guillouiae]
MIKSVQYLRGIAAVLVVLFHASSALMTHFTLGSKNYFSWGEAGVDLFFIISGFIMVYITYNKNISFKNFFLKRVIRIYPVFWVYASIALLIFLINPNMINRSTAMPTLILPSYLLIPYTEFTNLVQVAWTLVYEVHFYLLFGLSLFFANRYRYIAAGFMLSLVAALSVFNFDIYYLKFVTNPIILEFLLGMIIYFIIFKKNTKDLIFLSILFILSMLTLSLNEQPAERVIKYGVPSFIFMLVILYLDSIKMLGSGRDIFSKFLTALGDSSYSLYLSHIFCIGVGVIVLNKLQLINGSTAQFLIFILTIGSIIWGYISFKFIETPLINKLNSIVFKKK